MINILLSVRQPFSRKILSGEKTLELRKNMPRLRGREFETIWLYESGKDGERAIIGKCRLALCLLLNKEVSPDSLSAVCKSACVTEEHIFNYIPCFTWVVRYPVRLPHAVPLSAIGLTRPPQSWQYITDEQAAILERRASDEID